MIFLAPAFLLGFVALAIPVIIHLWSKNTQHSKPFGSIRFLSETETKTMRSVMPSQWLLLFTRLLILALLVFILADTFWKGNEPKIETVYLVDTVYEGTELLKTLNDSISSESRTLWLADEFPATELPVQGQVGDYWKLLSGAPLLAERTVVISPLLLKNFMSSRTSFPIDYSWLKLPVTPEEAELVSYQKGDEYFSIVGVADEWQTSYRVSNMSGGDPLNFSYFMKMEEGYELYRELFEAAITTLNSLSPLTISETADAEEADWIIWLTPNDPPNRKNVICIKDGSINKWDEISNGVVQISSDWSKEEAIKLNLPERLLGVLSDGLTDVTSFDRRTMDPATFTYSPLKLENDEESILESGMNALWLALLVLLILERWLAFKSEKS